MFDRDFILKMMAKKSEHLKGMMSVRSLRRKARKRERETETENERKRKRERE